jgi:hypothetical protein
MSTLKVMASNHVRYRGVPPSQHDILPFLTLAHHSVVLYLERVLKARIDPQLVYTLYKGLIQARC